MKSGREERGHFVRASLRPGKQGEPFPRQGKPFRGQGKPELHLPRPICMPL
jgi:hypothetical protein